MGILIKKYNDYIKESLLDKLQGPTKEDVEKYYKENSTQYLIKSVESGSIVNVRKALKYGADVNYDRNLLLSAIRTDNFKIVKELINYGININPNLYEPLRLAIAKDNIRILKLLLQNGYSLDIKIKYTNIYTGKDVYFTPYEVAKEHGSYTIMKYFSDFYDLKESLLDKISGPNDDEVIKYYLDNKKYTDLLYFGLRRLKYDIIKLALDNGADTKNLLQEIYDNDFSDDSFKKLFDIIDINMFDSDDIRNFLFKIYIEQREILIPKLDFNNKQIMYSILKELSYLSAYKTVDILFKNKLPNDLIIYLLNKSYDNNNIELFKYIIDNYEIPYHYDDDLLLYHIVSNNKWYKYDVLKLVLNKDVNIYARNNDIINKVIRGKEININIYNLFKEKDKKNLIV